MTTTAARARAASVSPVDRIEAAKSLQLIVAEAKKAGFVPYEFEARLALAEVEIASGDPAIGRVHLEALKKEASEKGFGLIDRKAAADINRAQS